MNLSEQRGKNKHSGKNIFAQGIKDLKSPIGTSIFGIIIIFGIVAMLVDYIGKRIGIPQSIMNVVIIIIIGITIVILSIKVSSSTKESIKRRKEAYERKFGGNKGDDRSG